jgi:predicted MPP superfamily phosphohydrolase
VKLSALQPGEQRIALFSDAHMYASQDTAPKPNSMGERIASSDHKTTEDSFVANLKAAKQIKDIDLLFFGGDMVTGYGEHGLVGSDSDQHVKEFKAVVKKYFKRLPKKFMAGGHEIGYILPLSTDPLGGPSAKSINAFQRHFDDLFYSFNLLNYKVVVLSSDLELLPSDSSEELKLLQDIQRSFCAKELNHTDQPIILMIHDPDALATLWPILKDHTHIIAKTFCGHQHAKWVNKLYPKLCVIASSKLLAWPLQKIFDLLFPKKAKAVWKYFQDNKGNAKIWHKLNLEIIPAPNGMFGIGGGFLIADLKPDGITVHKFKTRKH